MIITGTTYSVSHYEEYKKTGNSNIFEEVIDSMILYGIAGMNDSFRNAISNLPIEDKRMAILSLLDKDLNLFKKIKALTNKSINRLEHIKDIILMLREYVKVGEVEKKKFGEVMTPLELVKEMLATLPEEVWSNPNLKWLDPANGTGPYPSVVIYKLMRGLEEWEPDTEKRYKHIIENMIYTCELQAKNVFLWLCVADPFDQYNTNTYWGSFLDDGFDKHMKEVWGVEKFDIVIGNPPYNDDFTSTGDNKLYLLFISKILNSILIENGLLCFITPKKAIENLIDLSKNRNYIQNHKIVEYLAIDSPSRYFKVGSSFCFYTIKNKAFNNEKTTIEYLDFDKNIKSTKANIYLWPKLPKYFDDTTISILNKTVFNKQGKFDFKIMKRENNSNFRIRKEQISKGVIKLEEDLEFKYKILDKLKTKGITYYFINHKLVDHDKKKVIISRGGSYPCPLYDKNGEFSCSDNLLYILINNDENGKKMVDFINSKLIKFLEECMTKGSDMDFSWSICNIKKIDISIIKSNNDIYDLFKLDEREINLIENIIK